MKQVFSIGQSAAVLVEAHNGFGKPTVSLNQEKLNDIDKAHYAGDFLYICGLGFAKLSVLALIRLLTPNRRDQWIMIALEIFIAIWAVTALFTNAFICHVPHAWDYMERKCINRLAFWNYFEIANIITNSGLVVLPLLIVSKVQTSLRRKAKAMSAFSFRLAPIIASICKLVYWHREFNAGDPTLTLWPVYICTQAIQCAEISATCALYLRPFFQILQSGFINLDDLRRRGAMTPFTLGSSDTSKTIAAKQTIGRKGWSSAESSDSKGKESNDNLDGLGNFASARGPADHRSSPDETRRRMQESV
ncbi:MAG: hypothetical protein M1821_000634 [Bathelium mastoideum]|nr:MAG: hypothetical protein M1821_000634 [Bathelium mastoideum]